MKLRRTILIGLIGLIGSMGSAFAQDDSTGRLSLTLENHHFFKDNEFGLKRMDGYTLPGFYFRPKLVWQVEPRVKLSMGVHWLNYWGAHSYPTTLSYTTAHPTWSDTSSSMHILPWVQARVDFYPWLSVVIGSLENNNGHGLPTPLYNRELTYAADPEGGVQMLVQHRIVDVDAWADWREFIFNRSDHQEQFYLGLASHLKLPLGRWTPYVPIYALTQHTGGEGLNTAEFLHTKNKVNLGTGLGLRFSEDDFCADLEILLLRYHQVRDTTIPFNNGWAFSPTLRMRWKDLGMEVNWWDGSNFVPLMGCAHYSSVSINSDDVTFERFQNLTLKLEYHWHKFRMCEVVTEGEMIHYFPYTQNEPQLGVVEKGHATMISLGVHVKVKPTVVLKR